MIVDEKNTVSYLCPFKFPGFLRAVFQDKVLKLKTAVLCTLLQVRNTIFHHLQELFFQASLAALKQSKSAYTIRWWYFYL